MTNKKAVQRFNSELSNKFSVTGHCTALEKSAGHLKCYPRYIYAMYNL